MIDIKGEDWIANLSQELKKGAFVEKYGEMRFEMLEEIIKTCKDKEKEVIYTPMPTREGVIRFHRD